MAGDRFPSSIPTEGVGRIEPAFAPKPEPPRDLAVVKRERRQKVSAVCAVLRSDLYDRIADPEPEKADIRAVWESRLKLRCIYSYDQEAAEQPIQCTLIDSRGRVYAETDDADASWLDGAML